MGVSFIKFKNHLYTPEARTNYGIIQFRKRSIVVKAKHLKTLILKDKNMNSLFDMRDKIRRYFVLESHDVQWLMLSVLIMGLIVAIGYEMEQLNLMLWAGNLVSVILIIALAVIVRETAHKIMGLSYGWNVEFIPWFYGLIAGLLVAVLTFGKIPFLAYSGIKIHMLEDQRLGRFRYGISYFNLGIISLAAPMANLALAIIFKILMFLPNNTLIYEAMKINLLFALWNLLPIPPLDGANVMYANRGLWLFTFGMTVCITLLLLIKQVSLLTAILGSAFFGIILAAVYFILIEKYL